MLSEFVFELLGGVGPLDGFGRLIVRGDELHERSLQIAPVEK
jgi:hypothetical protein